MFRRRKTPVLLLKDQGLVKTIKFDKKNSKYVGDPINAVKIFNDFQADELIFLDIEATSQKRTISLDIVKNIGDEAFMPFAVGGGIDNLKQVESILKLGAERVIINSASFKNPNLVGNIVKEFGSSTVIVAIDLKKNFFGKYVLYTNCGKSKSRYPLTDYLKFIEDQGAGEIFVQSISNDRTYKGYDLDMINFVLKNTHTPIIPCGGCSSFKEFEKMEKIEGINSYAAGSVFVFFGPRKAVLINYPE